MKEEDDDNTIVVSSDSDDDGITKWARKCKNKQFRLLFERVQPILFHYVLPEYTSSFFPYGKFKEMAEDVRKTLKLVHVKSTQAFIWKNLIRWLLSMKLCYEGISDLRYDERYNLILTDFMAQYINYKCHLYSTITDETEVSRRVDEIIITLGLVFSGNTTSILMTLLKINVKDIYRLILDPIFRKYLSDRKAYKPDDLISYLRLILCYRQWKKLVHYKEDKELINEIAVGKSEKNLKTDAQSKAVEVTCEEGMLPKTVPEANEDNRTFAAITDLIGFAMRNKSYGTRILLINRSLDLEETIVKYFEQYEKHICQSDLTLCESTRPRRIFHNLCGNSGSSTPIPQPMLIVDDLKRSPSRNRSLMEDMPSIGIQNETEHQDQKELQSEENTGKQGNVDEHLSKDCDISNLSKALSRSNLSSNKKQLSRSLRKKPQNRSSDIYLRHMHNEKGVVIELDSDENFDADIDDSVFDNRDTMNPVRANDDKDMMTTNSSDLMYPELFYIEKLRQRALAVGNCIKRVVPGPSGLSNLRRRNSSTILISLSDDDDDSFFFKTVKTKNVDHINDDRDTTNPLPCENQTEKIQNRGNEDKDKDATAISVTREKQAPLNRSNAQISRIEKRQQRELALGSNRNRSRRISGPILVSSDEDESIIVGGNNGNNAAINVSSPLRMNRDDEVEVILRRVDLHPERPTRKKKLHCITGEVSSTTLLDCSSAPDAENLAVHNTETLGNAREVGILSAVRTPPRCGMVNTDYSDISDDDAGPSSLADGNRLITRLSCSKFSKVVEEATSSTSEIPMKAGSESSSENVVFSMHPYRKRRSTSSSPCPTRTTSPIDSCSKISPSSTIRTGSTRPNSRNQSEVTSAGRITERRRNSLVGTSDEREVAALCFDNDLGAKIQRSSDPAREDSEVATCSRYVVGRTPRRNAENNSKQNPLEEEGPSNKRSAHLSESEEVREMATCSPYVVRTALKKSRQNKAGGKVVEEAGPSNRRLESCMQFKNDSEVAICSRYVGAVNPTVNKGGNGGRCISGKADRLSTSLVEPIQSTDSLESDSISTKIPKATEMTSSSASVLEDEQCSSIDDDDDNSNLDKFLNDISILIGEPVEEYSFPGFNETSKLAENGITSEPQNDTTFEGSLSNEDVEASSISDDSANETSTASKSFVDNGLHPERSASEEGKPECQVVQVQQSEDPDKLVALESAEMNNPNFKISEQPSNKKLSKDTNSEMLPKSTSKEQGHYESIVTENQSKKSEVIVKQDETQKTNHSGQKSELEEYIPKTRKSKIKDLHNLQSTGISNKLYAEIIEDDLPSLDLSSDLNLPKFDGNLKVDDDHIKKPERPSPIKCIFEADLSMSLLEDEESNDVEIESPEYEPISPKMPEKVMALEKKTSNSMEPKITDFSNQNVVGQRVEDPNIGYGISKDTVSDHYYTNKVPNFEHENEISKDQTKNASIEDNSRPLSGREINYPQRSKQFQDSITENKLSQEEPSKDFLNDQNCSDQFAYYPIQEQVISDKPIEHTLTVEDHVLEENSCKDNNAKQSEYHSSIENLTFAEDQSHVPDGSILEDQSCFPSAVENSDLAESTFALKCDPRVVEQYITDDDWNVPARSPANDQCHTGDQSSKNPSKNAISKDEDAKSNDRTPEGRPNDKFTKEDTVTIQKISSNEHIESLSNAQTDVQIDTQNTIQMTEGAIKEKNSEESAEQAAKKSEKQTEKFKISIPTKCNSTEGTHDDFGIIDKKDNDNVEETLPSKSTESRTDDASIEGVIIGNSSVATYSMEDITPSKSKSNIDLAESTSALEVDRRASDQYLTDADWNVLVRSPAQDRCHVGDQSSDDPSKNAISKDKDARSNGCTPEGSSTDKSTKEDTVTIQKIRNNEHIEPLSNAQTDEQIYTQNAIQMTEGDINEKYSEESAALEVKRSEEQTEKFKIKVLDVQTAEEISIPTKCNSIDINKKDCGNVGDIFSGKSIESITNDASIDGVIIGNNSVAMYSMEDITPPKSKYNTDLAESTSALEGDTRVSDQYLTDVLSNVPARSAAKVQCDVDDQSSDDPSKSAICKDEYAKSNDHISEEPSNDKCIEEDTVTIQKMTSNEHIEPLSEAQTNEQMDTKNTIQMTEGDIKDKNSEESAALEVKRSEEQTEKLKIKVLDAPTGEEISIPKTSNSIESTATSDFGIINKKDCDKVGENLSGKSTESTTNGASIGAVLIGNKSVATYSMEVIVPPKSKFDADLPESTSALESDPRVSDQYLNDDECSAPVRSLAKDQCRFGDQSSVGPSRNGISKDEDVKMSTDKCTKEDTVTIQKIRSNEHIEPLSKAQTDEQIDTKNTIKMTEGDIKDKNSKESAALVVKRSEEQTEKLKIKVLDVQTAEEISITKTSNSIESTATHDDDNVGENLSGKSTESITNGASIDAVFIGNKSVATYSMKDITPSKSKSNTDFAESTSALDPRAADQYPTNDDWNVPIRSPDKDQCHFGDQSSDDPSKNAISKDKDARSNGYIPEGPSTDKSTKEDTVTIQKIRSNEHVESLSNAQTDEQIDSQNRIQMTEGAIKENKSEDSELATKNSEKESQKLKIKVLEAQAGEEISIPTKCNWTEGTATPDFGVINKNNYDNVGENLSGKSTETTTHDASIDGVVIGNSSVATYLMEHIIRPKSTKTHYIDRLDNENEKTSNTTEISLNRILSDKPTEYKSADMQTILEKPLVQSQELLRVSGAIQPFAGQLIMSNNQSSYPCETCQKEQEIIQSTRTKSTPNAQIRNDFGKSTWPIGPELPIILNLRRTEVLSNEEDSKDSHLSTEVQVQEDDLGNVSQTFGSGGNSPAYGFETPQRDSPLTYISNDNPIYGTEDQEVSIITSQCGQILPYNSYQEDCGTPVMDEKDSDEIESPTTTKIVSLSILKELPELPLIPSNPASIIPSNPEYNFPNHLAVCNYVPRSFSKSAGSVILDNSNHFSSHASVRSHHSITESTRPEKRDDIPTTPTTDKSRFIEPSPKPNPTLETDSEYQKTPLKIRLKRRISQCTGINEEFNLDRMESVISKVQVMNYDDKVRENVQSSYNVPLNLVMRSDKQSKLETLIENIQQARSDKDALSAEEEAQNQESWLKKLGISKTNHKTLSRELLSSTTISQIKSDEVATTSEEASISKKQDVILSENTPVSGKNEGRRRKPTRVKKLTEQSETVTDDSSVECHLVPEIQIAAAAQPITCQPHVSIYQKTSELATEPVMPLEQASLVETSYNSEDIKAATILSDMLKKSHKVEERLSVRSGKSIKSRKSSKHKTSKQVSAEFTRLTRSTSHLIDKIPYSTDTPITPPVIVINKSTVKKEPKETKSPANKKRALSSSSTESIWQQDKTQEILRSFSTTSESVLKTIDADEQNKSSTEFCSDSDDVGKLVIDLSGRRTLTPKRKSKGKTARNYSKRGTGRRKLTLEETVHELLQTAEKKEKISTSKVQFNEGMVLSPNSVFKLTSEVDVYLADAVQMQESPKTTGNCEDITINSTKRVCEQKYPDNKLTQLYPIIQITENVEFTPKTRQKRSRKQTSTITRGRAVGRLIFDINNEKEHENVITEAKPPVKARTTSKSKQAAKSRTQLERESKFEAKNKNTTELKLKADASVDKCATSKSNENELKSKARPKEKLSFGIDSILGNLGDRNGMSDTEKELSGLSTSPRITMNKEMWLTNFSLRKKSLDEVVKELSTPKTSKVPLTPPASTHKTPTDTSILLQDLKASLSPTDGVATPSRVKSKRKSMVTSKTKSKPGATELIHSRTLNSEVDILKIKEELKQLQPNRNRRKSLRSAVKIINAEPTDNTEDNEDNNYLKMKKPEEKAVHANVSETLEIQEQSKETLVLKATTKATLKTPVESDLKSIDTIGSVTMPEETSKEPKVIPEFKTAIKPPESNRKKSVEDALKCKDVTQTEEIANILERTKRQVNEKSESNAMTMPTAPKKNESVDSSAALGKAQNEKRESQASTKPTGTKKTESVDSSAYSLDDAPNELMETSEAIAKAMPVKRKKSVVFESTIVTPKAETGTLEPMAMKRPAPLKLRISVKDTPKSEDTTEETIKTPADNKTQLKGCIETPKPTSLKLRISVKDALKCADASRKEKIPKIAEKATKQPKETEKKSIQSKTPLKGTDVTHIVETAITKEQFKETIEPNASVAKREKSQEKHLKTNVGAEGDMQSEEKPIQTAESKTSLPTTKPIVTQRAKSQEQLLKTTDKAELDRQSEDSSIQIVESKASLPLAKATVAKREKSQEKLTAERTEGDRQSEESSIQPAEFKTSLPTIKPTVGNRKKSQEKLLQTTDKTDLVGQAEDSPLKIAESKASLSLAKVTVAKPEKSQEKLTNERTEGDRQSEESSIQTAEFKTSLPTIKPTVGNRKKSQEKLLQTTDKTDLDGQAEDSPMKIAESKASLLLAKVTAAKPEKSQEKLAAERTEGDRQSEESFIQPAEFKTSLPTIKPTVGNQKKSQEKLLQTIDMTDLEGQAEDSPMKIAESKAPSPTTEATVTKLQKSQQKHSKTTDMTEPANTAEDTTIHETIESAETSFQDTIHTVKTVKTSKVTQDTLDSIGVTRSKIVKGVFKTPEAEIAREVEVYHEIPEVVDKMKKRTSIDVSNDEITKGLQTNSKGHSKTMLEKEPTEDFRKLKVIMQFPRPFIGEMDHFEITGSTNACKTTEDTVIQDTLESPKISTKDVIHTVETISTTGQIQNTLESKPKSVVTLPQSKIVDNVFKTPEAKKLTVVEVYHEIPEVVDKKKRRKSINVSNEDLQTKEPTQVFKKPKLRMQVHSLAINETHLKVTLTKSSEVSEKSSRYSRKNFKKFKKSQNVVDKDSQTDDPQSAVEFEQAPEEKVDSVSTVVEPVDNSKEQTTKMGADIESLGSTSKAMVELEVKENESGHTLVVELIQDSKDRENKLSSEISKSTDLASKEITSKAVAVAVDKIDNNLPVAAVESVTATENFEKHAHESTDASVENNQSTEFVKTVAEADQNSKENEADLEAPLQNVKALRKLEKKPGPKSRHEKLQKTIRRKAPVVLIKKINYEWICKKVSVTESSKASAKVPEIPAKKAVFKRSQSKCKWVSLDCLRSLSNSPVSFRTRSHSIEMNKLQTAPSRNRLLNSEEPTSTTPHIIEDEETSTEILEAPEVLESVGIKSETNSKDEVQNQLEMSIKNILGNKLSETDDVNLSVNLPKILLTNQPQGFDSVPDDIFAGNGDISDTIETKFYPTILKPEDLMLKSTQTEENNDKSNETGNGSSAIKIDNEPTDDGDSKEELLEKTDGATDESENLTNVNTSEGNSASELELDPFAMANIVDINPNSSIFEENYMPDVIVRSDCLTDDIDEVIDGLPFLSSDCMISGNYAHKYYHEPLYSFEPPLLFLEQENEAMVTVSPFDVLRQIPKANVTESFNNSKNDVSPDVEIDFESELLSYSSLVRIESRSNSYSSANLKGRSSTCVTSTPVKVDNSAAGKDVTTSSIPKSDHSDESVFKKPNSVQMPTENSTTNVVQQSAINYYAPAVEVSTEVGFESYDELLADNHYFPPSDTQNDRKRKLSSSDIDTDTEKEATPPPTGESGAEVKSNIKLSESKSDENASKGDVASGLERSCEAIKPTPIIETIPEIKPNEGDSITENELDIAKCFSDRRKTIDKPKLNIETIMSPKKLQNHPKPFWRKQSNKSKSPIRRDSQLIAEPKPASPSSSIDDVSEIVRSFESKSNADDKSETLKENPTQCVEDTTTMHEELYPPRSLDSIEDPQPRAILTKLPALDEIDPNTQDVEPPTEPPHKNSNAVLNLPKLDEIDDSPLAATSDLSLGDPDIERNSLSAKQTNRKPQVSLELPELGEAEGNKSELERCSLGPKPSNNRKSRVMFKLPELGEIEDNKLKLERDSPTAKPPKKKLRVSFNLPDLAELEGNKCELEKDVHTAKPPKKSLRVSFKLPELDEFEATKPGSEKNLPFAEPPIKKARVTFKLSDLDECKSSKPRSAVETSKKSPQVMLKLPELGEIDDVQDVLERNLLPVEPPNKKPWVASKHPEAIKIDCNKRDLQPTESASKKPGVVMKLPELDELRSDSLHVEIPNRNPRQDKAQVAAVTRISTDDLFDRLKRESPVNPLMRKLKSELQNESSFDTDDNSSRDSASGLLISPSEIVTSVMSPISCRSTTPPSPSPVIVPSMPLISTPPRLENSPNTSEESIQNIPKPLVEYTNATTMASHAPAATCYSTIDKPCLKRHRPIDEKKTQETPPKSSTTKLIEKSSPCSSPIPSVSHLTKTVTSPYPIKLERTTKPSIAVLASVAVSPIPADKSSTLKTKDHEQNKLNVSPITVLLKSNAAAPPTTTKTIKSLLTTTSSPQSDADSLSNSQQTIKSSPTPLQFSSSTSVAASPSQSQKSIKHIPTPIELSFAGSDVCSPAHSQKSVPVPPALKLSSFRADVGSPIDSRKSVKLTPTLLKPSSLETVVSLSAHSQKSGKVLPCPTKPTSSRIEVDSPTHSQKSIKNIPLPIKSSFSETFVASPSHSQKSVKSMPPLPKSSSSMSYVDSPSPSPKSGKVIPPPTRPSSSMSYVDSPSPSPKSGKVIPPSTRPSSSMSYVDSPSPSQKLGKVIPPHLKPSSVSYVNSHSPSHKPGKAIPPPLRPSSSMSYNNSASPIHKSGKVIPPPLRPSSSMSYLNSPSPIQKSAKPLALPLKSSSSCRSDASSPSLIKRPVNATPVANPHRNTPAMRSPYKRTPSTPTATVSSRPPFSEPGHAIMVASLTAEIESLSDSLDQMPEVGETYGQHRIRKVLLESRQQKIEQLRKLKNKHIEESRHHHSNGISSKSRSHSERQPIGSHSNHRPAVHSSQRESKDKERRRGYVNKFAVLKNGVDRSEEKPSTSREHKTLPSWSWNPRPASTEEIIADLHSSWRNK